MLGHVADEKYIINILLWKISVLVNRMTWEDMQARLEAMSGLAKEEKEGGIGGGGTC